MIQRLLLRGGVFGARGTQNSSQLILRILNYTASVSRAEPAGLCPYNSQLAMKVKGKRQKAEGRRQKAEGKATMQTKEPTCESSRFVSRRPSPFSPSPEAGARRRSWLRRASPVWCRDIFTWPSRDLETGQKFWAMLGGTPIQNGALQLIQFPGTFVMLRKAEPSGGTVGSTVEHFGFHVKNLNESLAQWQAAPVWQAAGVKWAPTNATQGFLTGPDDVRIEVIQNTAIDTPIRFHHVHFFTASAVETQAWYAKMFGAAPGKRASFDAADLPGVNLTFSKAETPVVGTRGRSLDHIGFEVRNLEQFIKKLEASGIKMDRAVHEDCELSHRDRLSDRSLGHLHRADGEPRAREVRH